MEINVQYKNSEVSRRMQGKRSLAILDTVKVELKTELELLFDTFQKALNKTQKQMSEFPPLSRSRTLEASIMQSCFAEMLMLNFGDKAFYGKHKRLVLSVKGYIILFKKLDKKGMPMNITTANVHGIMSQNMQLDLFAQSGYNDAPILYFGYQKNGVGQYVNPQIVYIDDSKISFVISDEIFGNIKAVDNLSTDKVAPKLKDKISLKKAE
ncbi:hypothetical protein ACR79Q_19385 [Sphingobacterium multivorum]|uniref:hypothetical protein n=1 Tax=Sphingobacterium multivorum TaxID=28454 RepID=UPI003DA594C8